MTYFWRWFRVSRHETIEICRLRHDSRVRRKFERALNQLWFYD